MEGQQVFSSLLILTSLLLQTESIDVRVVGGNAVSTGRVEIKYNGTWGTVCDFNWDTEDCHVICRMLGFEKAKKKDSFGPGIGPIWLDDVSCRGDESSIEECRHRGWGVTDCDHDDDIGVICQPRVPSSTKFRLVDGAGPHTGILQAQHDNTWGNVTADSFDVQDAHVVCRMIGFSQAVAIFTHHANSTFTMTMDCNGHESSILQCKHFRIQQTLPCLNKSSIGIVCKPSSGSWTSNLRLSQNSSAELGRVEIEQYGVWGTVCNHGWSMRDANVVCRMLRYKGAVTASQSFGSGKGPIWLTELQCKGNEKDIMNCTHGGLGQANLCSHDNDAGVICHSYAGDLKVHLAGGGSPLSGQVQVWYNGQWGAVCGYYWDIEEANVVCRMLNYSRALAAISNYRRGTDKFWVNGVRCSGTENSISLCDHWGWGKRTCSANDDAGVICEGDTSQLPNVAFRLVDGNTPNQGRVEVRYYGVWGTVCQHYWKLTDAHVVCRMLNYSRASWAGTAKQQKSAPILLTRLDCHGNEKRIDECHPRWGVWYCYGYQDAGVTCEDISPEAFSVIPRLVKYSTSDPSHFGQVEVNYKGIWIPVCDDTWDISDAHVICRMLGYKKALVAIKRFGSGKSALWLGGVKCSGDEESISECYHRGWTNTRCTGNHHAGVMCKITEDSPSVQVRLEDGSSPNSGRIAVRYGNVWGTICNRGLDINDAKVICRMLGYPGASKVYPKSTFRAGNGTIWLSNLECNGTESSIVDCRHPGWGQTTCNHDNDGAILCKEADAPRLVVNGSREVTESTLTVLVEASIKTQLRSSIQFIVEEIEEPVFFNSLEQEQTPLPSNLGNKTIAVEISPSIYITGEVMSSSLVNFTIGDGQYYHGYYNAPLEPGSMYRVHVRIVTMAMDEKRVYSNTSFVVFATKAPNHRTEETMGEKKTTFLEMLVLCFSIAIIVLVIVIIGCFVKFNIRRKRKITKKQTSGNSGNEMTTGDIKSNESADNSDYQALIHFLPYQTAASCHGNTLKHQQSCRYVPAMNEKVENNRSETQDPLYANIH